MLRRTRRALGALTLATATLGLTAVAASASKDDDLPVFGPGREYHPEIEAADFTPDVDNRWFPLTPGTTLTYVGTKDGEPARELVTTTDSTKVIDGVTTRVVFDRLYLSGKLAERTFDYYAQDDDGNVWYFGEDTVALDDNGNLTDTEGSFRAGVDGAEPGVFMERHPEVGRRFRQEWSPGQAEDQFRVVSRHARVTVPYGAFHNALQTEETTDLEPGVLDQKFYVRGIGEVAERSVHGPPETADLVSVESNGRRTEAPRSG
jgi:hypothetical protein